MNAKTIIIEAVVNGWLVRPWNGGCWDPGRETEIYVYRDIGDLQKDLPKLLNAEIVDMHIPTCNEFQSCDEPRNQIR